MAVIAHVTLRGVSKEQYDAVRSSAGWIEQPPTGGLAHLAWWEGDDNHNVDAWESEAAFAAFGEQRLAPAMAAAGVEVAPDVTFTEAHEVLLPREQVLTATPASGAAPSDDVASLRQGYAAFASGDIPAVLALMDEQIRWTTPDSVALGGTFTGPAGVMEFFTSLSQNYADLHVEPATYVDRGDTVVVLGRHRGRTTAGVDFELPFAHVWTFSSGRATSFTEHFDTARMNEALAGSTAGMVPASRSPETQFDPRTLLRRIFDEIINEGRLEVANELFADDYVDHGPMGDIAGREAFVAMVAQWRAAVPDVHCEVEHVFVEGDHVGWIVRTTGTHTGDALGFPATGRRFETVSANLGRFRDGKAVEHWAEQGMFPMLRQIGVLPMMAPSA